MTRKLKTPTGNNAIPNLTRMITPYLTNDKIGKLDQHVVLGHAKSRSDLIRTAIDYWLDNHPLPDEVEVLKLRAQAKQDGTADITTQ